MGSVQGEVPVTQFDFLILCYPRSGSHVLASALDSHPDISCDGHIISGAMEYRPDGNHHGSGGSVIGCILMYNHWKAYNWLVTAPKVIHLVRDPFDTAKSYLAIRGCKKIQISHHFAPTSNGYELDAVLLTRAERLIYHRIHSVQEQIKNIPNMEISYEEITGNKSVSQINPVTAKRLTDFLGVAEAPLVTKFVKPTTTYIIREDL